MKAFLCFSLAFLVGFASSSVLKSSDESSKSSESVPNTECRTLDGNKGVCQSIKQCTEGGGVASMTPCEDGCGVCCTYTQWCPSDGSEVIVKNNQTVITSTAFPHSCKFVIPKQPGVCQVRLDFERFNLGSVVAPTNPPLPPWSDIPEHNCNLDSLTISSTGNLPDGLTICGNAQDHVYLEYADCEKLTLDINAVTDGGYDIRVTMIDCDSEEKAPEGCTQYFTNRTGQIQSFNYPFSQLNSQHYSVCIGNPDEAEKITWRPCEAPFQYWSWPQVSPFSVSGQNSGVGNSTPTFCAQDHVLLPGTPDERYCGGNFTGEVESYKLPFLMWVDFNGWEIPKEVTEQSKIIDPVTSCPLYQNCIDMTGVPTIPTPPSTCESAMGTCAVSQIYVDMIDIGNTGLCLEYSVG